MSCEASKGRVDELFDYLGRLIEDEEKMRILRDDLEEWLEENINNPEVGSDDYKNANDNYYAMEAFIEGYEDEWWDTMAEYEQAEVEWEECMAEHKNDPDTIEFPLDEDIEEPEFE